MNNIEKFTLLGWVCLIYSLIANFQLTLAIIFALIIMLITFSALTDKNNDDIEDALETMNTSLVNDAQKLVDVIDSLDDKYKRTLSGYIDGLRTIQALNMNKEKEYD